MLWAASALLAIVACSSHSTDSAPGTASGGGSGASSTSGDGTSDGSPLGNSGSAGSGPESGDGGASGSTGSSGDGSAADSSVACTPGGISGASGPGETSFTAVPNLPKQSTNVAGNACSGSLGADWGTNFAYPVDPSAPVPDGGPAIKNQSILGWEGNLYAPFAYLSGSFFARGVVGTYTQGAKSYCGTMFSFGVYDAYPHAAGSVQWTMDDGYLPALTTAFTSFG